VPQIFIMNYDGSDVIQITSLQDGACQPDWSPDGSQIVFISPCFERTDVYPDSRLYIVNADGTGLTPLLNSDAGDFDPSWSPDGTRIAFTSLRDGTLQIYVLDLRDNSVTALTTYENDNGEREALQPDWSPDGSQILYSVRRIGVSQIWVMSDTGLGQTQIVRSGLDYWDSLPTWSPDGEMVVFTQTRSDQRTWGYTMFMLYADRALAQGRQLSNRDFAFDVSFSSDGQWLFFENSLDSMNFDIYRVNADGSGTRAIVTDVPEQDFDPAWRPTP
jgi:Tol biopolymer transport system component